MRKLIPILLASAGAALVALPFATAQAQAPKTPASGPAPGIVLYDAAGTPVAILRPVAMTSPPAAAVAPDPGFALIRAMQASMPQPFSPGGFFAQQDAMMQQMMQQAANFAAAPMASPGLIEAALGAAPGTASQVVVTSFSDGDGSCSQTVTYRPSDNGGAPLVAVHQVGNACGALPQMAPVPTAAPVPSDRIPPPDRAPDGSRLIRVDYRMPVSQPLRQHG